VNTKAAQRAALVDLITRSRQIVVELEILLSHMHNRPAKRRGRVTSPPVALVRDKIIEMHRADPDMPQHDIAHALGINSGRVNNVLRGIRR
jgi:hypothetical protein